MKVLALFPIGMLVILSGCMPIIWYPGFPDVNHSPDASANEAVTLSYVISSTPHWMPSPIVKEREEALMRQIIQREFSHWTEVDPNKGQLDNHVEIYIESSTHKLPFSTSAELNYIYMQDKLKYSVRYDLYSSGQLSRYGPYRFSRMMVGSALFIPLFWVNWLTSSKEEAFLATLQQFVLDAQREGYL